jgi:aryl-alcohol dehydrogenase-like predicted oxidoreductase
MLFGGDGGTGTGECSSNNGGIDFATASRLMSACAESGAAFFDSSEMYPVPPSEATWGRSEDMLGRWANEYGR